MMDLLFTASSFFFTDTATSQRYTLSLHDALPISVSDQVNSLPLGAVRVSEDFIKSDPLRPKHWRKLRKNVDRELRHELGRPPFSPETMIGSGGTFTALAHMAKWEREGRHGSVQGY